MSDCSAICDPICDFCVHYRFNADAEGAYTGNGRCEHPDHPKRMEPSDCCVDFACMECGMGALELLNRRIVDNQNRLLASALDGHAVVKAIVEAVADDLRDQRPEDLP